MVNLKNMCELMGQLNDKGYDCYFKGEKGKVVPKVEYIQLNYIPRINQEV